ncbi:MAG: alkaline phosphatase family protein [Propionibacteriales bacterium]|nr:alkaline phosphatase family protein [Propionibacteriales bacterium]
MSGRDGNVLGLPASRRLVLLLVDGLGGRLLADYASDAPYLSSLPARTITCNVPSTTVTSLTSLGVGTGPGQHGLVGYTCRIPGTDRLLNGLKWDRDVDPREWQPLETAFARAARAGVRTTVVNKRSFEDSGLTVAGQRGADFAAADSAGERLAAAALVAAEAPSLVYVYDGDLDWTGHRHGCRSEAWRHQLAIVDAFAARLREVIPDDATLVVTADHGMVDIPASGRVDADTEDDLLDGVETLAGEARFRHLHCRSGAVDDVVAAWGERLGADALVVRREEAIAAGWFGEMRTSVALRLGDVMIACLGDVAVESSVRFPHESKLFGLHGSLTADEMLVPLLVDLG